MVILMGNVGNIETRFTGNGTAVANISLATNQAWKDGEGNLQERTEWHRLVAWGKQAEVLGQYVSKGTPLHVVGELQTKKWDDKDGNTRYTTEIKVNQFQFIGQGNNNNDGGATANGTPSASTGRTAVEDTKTAFEPDDELPF